MSTREEGYVNFCIELVHCAWQILKECVEFFKMFPFHILFSSKSSCIILVRCRKYLIFIYPVVTVQNYINSVPMVMLIFFSKVKYVYVRIQIKLVCSCLCWCGFFFKIFVSLHLILLEIVVLNYIKRIFKEKRTVMSHILG